MKSHSITVCLAAAWGDDSHGAANHGNIIVHEGRTAFDPEVAAEKRRGTLASSAAWMKLQTSLNCKAVWNCDPKSHGNREVPPPPPKDSCPDGARYVIARVAAQIRTDLWGSAIFLKRIRKRAADECWYCPPPPPPDCWTSLDDPAITYSFIVTIQGSRRPECVYGTINNLGAWGCCLRILARNNDS